MPFANVRVRMHIRGPGVTFSEAHYRPATEITEALLVTANQLCDKRRLCLCKSFDLHSYSVNAVQERHVGQPRRKNDGGGLLGFARDAGNVVQNILLLSGARNRNYAVHGLPDQDVKFAATSGQDLSAASNETKAFLDFLTAPANGWGMRAETKRAGDPANPVITAITLAAGGVAFAVAGLAVVPGDKVKVTGCQGFLARQFNGDWKVGSYAGGILTCQTIRRIDTRFTYVLSSGQLRVVDAGFYSYPGYTGWDPLSVESGTRKTKKSRKK